MERMKDTRALENLARLLKNAERGAQIAQELGNEMKPTYGTIVDVDDPECQGRVKVILDEMNPDIIQDDYGWDQSGAQPTKTDWIFPHIPLVGKQPKALVDKRVPITPRAGDPNRLFFGDPVYDPEETDKAEQPANSSMTRLPVYASDELPEPSEENRGCMLIEAYEDAWERDIIHVCLKVNGEWRWIALEGTVSESPPNINPKPCDPGVHPQQGKLCPEEGEECPPDGECEEGDDGDEDEECGED